MSKSSPQVLGRVELMECARAIAVMVTRFKPKDIGRFYTAVDIAENLCQLPQGQLSTFHVATDTLKKALANKTLKLALSTILPGRFEYMRSGTRYDVITTGRNSFPKGYQIKFILLVNDPADLRKEISNLRDSLVTFYTEQDAQLTTAVKKLEEGSEVMESPDLISALTSTTSSSSVTSTAIENRRKRGRPELKKEEIDKTIIKLRNQVHYRNSSAKKSKLSFEEERGDDDPVSAGQKVLDIIKEVGTYTERINGEECVSIVSGLLIQDLISNCGCSVEKIPLIIGTVLTMLIGELDEKSYSAIVKSHNTYALASERTALLAVIEVRQRFVDRAAENRILYAWLILDASNKKGKGCVGKIIIFAGIDGVVRQLALRLDTTVTKKALGSSQLTIESLESELGDGIVWIMGITTDAFGAAVEEASLVLKHIDTRASELYLSSPDMFHRKSLTVPGQIYRYGEKFRELCVSRRRAPVH